MNPRRSLWRGRAPVQMVMVHAFLLCNSMPYRVLCNLLCNIIMSCSSGAPRPSSPARRRGGDPRNERPSREGVTLKSLTLTLVSHWVLHLCHIGCYPYVTLGVTSMATSPAASASSPSICAELRPSGARKKTGGNGTLQWHNG